MDNIKDFPLELRPLVNDGAAHNVVSRNPGGAFPTVVVRRAAWRTAELASFADGNVAPFCIHSAHIGPRLATRAELIAAGMNPGWELDDDRR